MEILEGKNIERERAMEELQQIFSGFETLSPGYSNICDNLDVQYGDAVYDSLLYEKGLRDDESVFKSIYSLRPPKI